MIETEKIIKDIYEQVKTPYKYGSVLKRDGYMVDSPTVFEYGGRWYMYYVKISKDIENSGYETCLASSDNLIDWKDECVILQRTNDGKWDSKQRGGYAAFVDINFGASNQIQKVNGKYYMTYIGGENDGYEADPLHMGLAYSDNPINADSFETFDMPILSPYDKDAREFETKTIYKGNMCIDDAMTTGHKYIVVYNSKPDDDIERIYIAVSDDAENWKRFCDNPLIDESKKLENLVISGDPQIVKIDDIYVMFYYRYIKGVGAYNTFACSKDMVNWTAWEGEPLIKSEYEWENVFAHKSWVLKKDDIVYHFYCATNDKNDRFIALATSKKL